MLETLSSLLAVIHQPTMWFMMALFTLLAVVALVVPDRLRGVARMFTQFGPARVLGLLLMFVGTEMFLRGTGAGAHPMLRWFGVASFLAGGVCAMVPTLTVILAEKWVALPSSGQRVLALVFLAIAFMFYVAQGVPVPAHTL